MKRRILYFFLATVSAFFLHGCSKCSADKTAEPNGDELPPPVELNAVNGQASATPAPESPETSPDAAPDLEESEQLPDQ